MTPKKSFTLSVDKEYSIVVDEFNWTVIQKKDVKSGDNKGDIRNTAVAYCHDLPGALRSIVRDMTFKSAPTRSIPAYLSWYDSTIHSVANRVLEQRETLCEAYELNKAI